MRQVKKAAVLGAGVMGAGIAAHLANAGLKVLLLDMVPREVNESEKVKGMTLESMAVRNRLADTGIQQVFSLASNYRQKQPLERIVAPGRTIAAALKNRLRENTAGGSPTEYELELTGHVADIMTGGDVSAGTLISEQHLLDLERQKLRQLSSNSKTLARIQHMLKVGKVLRN